MKVLRIKLRQSQASFAKEETTTNRMTYPLPPYSTVIGALHATCGYETYHPMDLSIQGKFGSMQREMYVGHAFLNSTQDDRNLLVYLKDPNYLSAGLSLVGQGLKTQGNSFLKNQTVRIDNEALYQHYLDLNKKKKALEEEKKALKVHVDSLKAHEKALKEKQKKVDKKSQAFEDLKKEIKDTQLIYKTLNKDFKDREIREYKEPYSHFRTLVKAPKYQEVLYDLDLVIHIRAQEETLKDIQKNINNLVCLGRSEDFIDLVDIGMVDLVPLKKTTGLLNNYKIYVNLDRINQNSLEGMDKEEGPVDRAYCPPEDEAAEEDKPFFYKEGNQKRQAKGTVYYVNKDYRIEGGKRVFNRIPCLYTSAIGADEESEGVYMDSEGYLTDFN
ncbi:MAG: CRISPR-associated protein Cas5 [Tissierellia bacterium]|nr:CRISPR-associated protein Cas5 [Tissierellia bacterium]